jgi:hypothetical protein
MYLALTLEMGETGGVLDKMEQHRCQFCGQTLVHLRYHILRFLHFMDSGRNGFDGMGESHDGPWKIWDIWNCKDNFSKFSNPSENLPLSSYWKSNIQTVHPEKKTTTSQNVQAVAALAISHMFSEGCDLRGQSVRNVMSLHGRKLLRRLPHNGRLLEYLLVHPMYKQLKPWPKCEYNKVDIYKLLETSSTLRNEEVYSIFKV